MATVIRRPVKIEGVYTLTVSTTDGTVGRSLSDLSQQGYPFTGQFSILGAAGINLIDIGVEKQGADAAIQAISRELKVLSERYKVLSFGLSSVSDVETSDLKVEESESNSRPSTKRNSRKTSTKSSESKFVKPAAVSETIPEQDNQTEVNNEIEDQGSTQVDEKPKTLFSFGSGNNNASGQSGE